MNHKADDRSKYQREWTRLTNEGEDGMDARVYEAAERLAVTYSKRPRQSVTVYDSKHAAAEVAASDPKGGARFNFRVGLKRQPSPAPAPTPAPADQGQTRGRSRGISSSAGGTIVGALVEQANLCNEPMHAVMKTWVESLGGRYDKGPLKTIERILEKSYTDYAGDPLRVVDIVRGTAVFVTLAQLAFALESLLDNSCELLVVRAKDRMNNPTSFGYSDILLNVRLHGDGPYSQHIGELQLHLEAMHAIKPATHKTYTVLRSVGWEDHELEGHDQDEDDEVDEDDVRALSGTELAQRVFSNVGSLLKRPSTFRRSNPLAGGRSSTGIFKAGSFGKMSLSRRKEPEPPIQSQGPSSEPPMVSVIEMSSVLPNTSGGTVVNNPLFASASASASGNGRGRGRRQSKERTVQKAASQQEARQEAHDDQTGPQLRRVGSTPKNTISFDNALDNDLFEIGLDDVVAVEDESDIEDGGGGGSGGGGGGGGGGTTTAAENFLEPSQRSVGPGTGLRRKSSVSFTNPMLNQQQLTAMAKSARGFKRSDTSAV